MKNPYVRVVERIPRSVGFTKDCGIIKIGILSILFWCMPIVAVCDNVIDLPPSGSDVSGYRCEGGIVSSGDPPRDVIEKCGEPIERGKLTNRKYDVWVYYTPKANFVYYLAFLNQRLQRIYSVSCIKNDPHCE